MSGCGRRAYLSHYAARMALKRLLSTSKRMTSADYRSEITRCDECRAWHLRED